MRNLFIKKNIINTLIHIKIAKKLQVMSYSKDFISIVDLFQIISCQYRFSSCCYFWLQTFFTACQLQLGESELGFEIKSTVGDKMTGGVVNDWFLAAVTTTNMTNGALCLTRPQTHIFILSDNIITRTSPRFMAQSHMLWHDLSALDKSAGEQNYVMLHMPDCQFNLFSNS